MVFQADWIKASNCTQNVCPVFRKIFSNTPKLRKADLYITSLGVYEAEINGRRVGEYVLAPGWTAYEKRLQYQVYDVTELLEENNEIRITLGKGWYRSPMPGGVEPEIQKRVKLVGGIIAELHLYDAKGGFSVIKTDQEWQWAESSVRFSEIYDGEVYDATFIPKDWQPVQLFDGPSAVLIPQEGEEIREMERVEAADVFKTPAGEIIVDFGQEVTGYVEFNVQAEKGAKVSFKHGEVLDKYGNFYNANYRTAKAEVTYICKKGKQTWHPHLTFFGFRYIKLIDYPEKPVKDNFTAVVVYSKIRRTGSLSCGVEELNQLFSNILWGQKGNFLDVPTDCPQRDERLGWTGDAQVFVKTASYNYDVEKFYRKWLRDLKAEQGEDGSVGWVIPDYLRGVKPSAAWGDAAVICPWQIYLTYGNKAVLEEQFESMKKWVDYITGITDDQYLWTGGEHLGDWLALDATPGSYKGSSRDDFIASAYYAYSTELVIKAGRVLGKSVRKYEELREKIVKKFRETFPQYYTQTEHVLAVQFGLAVDKQKTADDLAELIRNDGGKMRTGFVGTSYILQVLCNYGHADLAYSLLLRREYPSWLYSVNKGATTIWEHWDGIMEDGEFWSEDMNSFNHYAYGAVAGWIYESAAGICLPEDAAGFTRVVIKPNPDERLRWLCAEIDTRNGKVKSSWKYIGERIRFEIEADMPLHISLKDKEADLVPGTYIFWEEKTKYAYSAK